MDQNKSKKMLEEGAFGTLLLKLSLPAVVVIVIMIIYNIADTYFIGQTGDPNKIAAISLSMPVFGLLSGLGTLLGTGGTTVLSMAYGQGDESKVKKTSAFCLASGGVTGLLFFGAIYFFTEPLALLLGADQDTLELTLVYLRVFAFSAPLVVLNQSFGSLMRADGDATLAMLVTMSGTVLNILLDWLFVIIFKWDVFGAALATDLGNALTTVLLFVIVLRKKKMLIPGIKDFAFDPALAGRIVSLGLPMSCSTALSSVSNTIQNRLMISHGATALAAQGVAGKVGMVVTMLIMGVCIGMQPAISFNYGAKNIKRMKWVVRNTGIFSVALGIVLSILAFIFKDAVVAAFIENEEVIAYGRVFVFAAVIVGPFYAIYQLCQTYMQSTGKASYAIVASLLDKGLIFIPVLYIADAVSGVYGIAFSHAITMVFTLIVTVILTLKWTKSLDRKL
ncbi:MAG: MATE family efflux transporter [Pseudobutyrivibrio sp.]|nr:MATE family efflux transporter [Pseudobutyrivibrio sp.]